MAKGQKALKKAAEESLAAVQKLVDDTRGKPLGLLGDQIALWVAPLKEYIDHLESETTSEKVKRLKEELSAQEKEIQRLRFDWGRMNSSRHTSFSRCPKCKGLHDSVLVCFCGYDEG